jgi:hypothetical protein
VNIDLLTLKLFVEGSRAWLRIAAVPLHEPPAARLLVDHLTRR